MAEAGRPFWMSTHPGLVRKSNQDRALVLDKRTTGEREAWNGRAAGASIWAAVADGMGGHSGGAIAAEIAMSAVADNIGRTGTEAGMAQLVIDANSRIFEAMYSGEGEPRMGTTLVTVAISGRTALIGHVGDSRVYLVGPAGLLRLTRDHTIDGGLSRMRHHALTQSLGGLTREVPIRPQVLRVTLGQAESLLLCSDGLTDMIDDHEIADIMARSRGELANDLVDAALEAGGRDNVTVVVLGATGAT